jgi:hypothetical protein
MKIRLLLALASICSAALATDVPLGNPSLTILTMGLDIGNGFVAPRLASRVTVPYYVWVQLRVPDGWQQPIQWTKDGTPLAGATGGVLIIAPATSADTGLYNLVGAPWPTVTTGIKLTVAPAERLTNLSSRHELAAGDSVVIAGLVISGERPKSLLVRAVGPSLAQFGVAHPAALPRLRFFDAKGKEIEWVHVAVVIDWAPIFAAVGAFPLTGGEREWIAFTQANLPPGVYSVHVSDDAKQGGTVLVEIYDLP